jgi:activator of HSP90 ATPase
MTRTIEQRIQFEGVTPQELFDTYVDPRLHSKAIGAPVTMSRETGATFAAFGQQMVRGKNLLVSPRLLIVQTWRAQVWKDSDPDSVLILRFVKSAGGAAIELVQSGVPDGAYEKIRDGWNEMYWKPWSRFVNGTRERVSPAV